MKDNSSPSEVKSLRRTPSEEKLTEMADKWRRNQQQERTRSEASVSLGGNEIVPSSDHLASANESYGIEQIFHGFPPVQRVPEGKTMKSVIQKRAEYYFQKSSMGDQHSMDSLLDSFKKLDAIPTRPRIDIDYEPLESDAVPVDLEHKLSKMINDTFQAIQDRIMKSAPNPDDSMQNTADSLQIAYERVTLLARQAAAYEQAQLLEREGGTSQERQELIEYWTDLEKQSRELDELIEKNYPQPIDGLSQTASRNMPNSTNEQSQPIERSEQRRRQVEEEDQERRRQEWVNEMSNRSNGGGLDAIVIPTQGRPIGQPLDLFGEYEW